MKTQKIILSVLLVLAVIGTVGYIATPVENAKIIEVDVKKEITNIVKTTDPAKFLRFGSEEEFIKFFEDKGRYFRYNEVLEAAPANTQSVRSVVADFFVSDDSSAKADFSETNIQVQGVDEADLIKTDGEYIYLLAQGELIIAKAYPKEDAKIISRVDLKDVNPYELFIYQERLLVFGNQNFEHRATLGELVREPRYWYATSALLYDISNKEEPTQLREVSFEGNYKTSRMIDGQVYVVVTSYPKYAETCEEIVPLYADQGEVDMIMPCMDIGYVKDIEAHSFITVAGISMIDENKEIVKEVIVGNAENIYMSHNNLYVAQTSYEQEEKTVVTKFSLKDERIKFAGVGSVPGHILNQFSMDEFENHFRIATTKGQVWDNKVDSTNNVYVLNSNLKVVGSVEDLAPGERIYSVRFMGKKGYIVTFKKVDPLFVIDLENPHNPTVLGKLKIPGYSDYLHPYDENHLIGIGKDTVEAKEGDFAWYQGIKMAIFDVSDVENPIELHKVIIGDRGTDSPVLYDHKALLFDREQNLLVMPITLAKIKGEKSRDNQHGDYVFQGAYVFDVTLDDGFDLRGKVTHYENDDVFLKSGYYYHGDRDISRSLFIGDVLYTLSEAALQLNDLNSLEKIKVLEFEDNGGIIY